MNHQHGQGPHYHKRHKDDSAGTVRTKLKPRVWLDLPPAQFSRICFLHSSSNLSARLLNTFSATFLLYSMPVFPALGSAEPARSLPESAVHFGASSRICAIRVTHGSR